MAQSHLPGMSGLFDQFLKLLGRSGGQTAIGGTDAGDDLTLQATSSSTDGDIIFKSDPTTQSGRIDDKTRIIWGASGNGEVTIAGTVYGAKVTTNVVTPVAGTGNIAVAEYKAVYSADLNGPQIAFLKSRNTTPGSHTVVQSGDTVGLLAFYASDGTDFEPAAQIAAYVDGTPGNNDMPGRLSFATSADGAAAATERMRITNAGTVVIGGQSAAQWGGALEIQTFSAQSDILVQRNVNDTSGVAIALVKTRGTTSSGRTIVSSGDTIGSIIFYGADGSTVQQAASINCTVGTTPGSSDMPGTLTFKTSADGSASPSTRMTIDYFGAVAINAASGSSTSLTVSHSNSSSAFTITDSNASSRNNFVQSTNNTDTNQIEQYLQTYAAGGGGGYFMLGQSDADGSSDNEFYISHAGTGTCDGAWNGGGADYAEYFEWADGNPNDEDRRGCSVVLEGDKIRIAVTTDVHMDIIGVISARPTVVGDGAELKWRGKFECDEFGARLYEDYNIYSWPDCPPDSNGAPRENYTVEQAARHGITIPPDATVTTARRKKLAADFDPGLTYVPRSQRKEWAAVGLVGKIVVRNDQQIGDRWKLLRAGEKSSLYLVR